MVIAITVYTRVPSTFFELSLSKRRLRTTPARKPRTECCCQPVSCIIAAIVVPAGNPSNAITRACLEIASFLLSASERAMAGREDFTTFACARLDLDDGFFAGFLGRF